MNSLALILRDHRDQLRQRWIDELDGRVDPDYRELLASPLGERALRTIVDDLVTMTQAEEYEVPGIRRHVEERAAADAAHWISLGFTVQDVVCAVHALRGAVIDVLLDALVQDEMPSFGDSLDQLKVLDAFLDSLVREHGGELKGQDMLRLALIFGGRSAEHEISLASARFVAQKLDRSRYDVIPVGITREGHWVLPRNLDDALQNGLDDTASDPVHLVVDPARPGLLLADGAFRPLDFAFPIMHGTFAEDGTIQGLLEMAGLAYAGSGVVGSSVGMDKELMKAIFANAGLPQVPHLTLRDAEATGRRAVSAVEDRLAYPVFVKPANLGSSVGMTKAHDRGELGPALDLATAYDRKVIIEAACVGRELECSLLGNDEPLASVAGEVMPANEFYDYEAKYTEGKMAFAIPADVGVEAQAETAALAVAAFKAIDAAGFARCDFFLESASGRVLLNEINTIPGMTAMSGFPRLWAASGVDGSALVERIVQLGLERHAARSRLRTRH